MRQYRPIKLEINGLYGIMEQMRFSEEYISNVSGIPIEKEKKSITFFGNEKSCSKFLNLFEKK